jgi:integrase
MSYTIERHYSGLQLSKMSQNQLGHANPTITLNVYAHLMEDRNPEAAQRLENAVFGANGRRKQKGATVFNRNP